MMISRASRAGERRGIVLVLVLAMLGLLALVGVTFATYANQSKINNKQFMLSLFQPQADELIDFGLAQLITDTNDIRSVIRGHSLARDMFGNDATGNNSLLSFSPASGLPFSITQATTGPNPNQYLLTTNIAQNDSSFFGYDFTRWIMRVSYNVAPTNGGTGTITQSFEVLADSKYNFSSNNPRTLLVYINPIDAGGSIPVGWNLNTAGLGGTTSVAGTAADPYLPVGMGTALYNPTPQGTTFPNGFLTQLPGLYLATAVANNTPLGNGTFTFTLDGRQQHAFNGPGASALVSATTGLPSTYYGNYRFTGPLNTPTVTSPGLGTGGTNPLNPGTVGMDEDYDACDLENWFMAIQSADGQVIVPSFHRPGIIRVDTPNNTNDWLGINQSGPNGAYVWADSAARILRPRKVDGHDSATFKDLTPDLTSGQIDYDVDNDGDGKTDSVWLDLGYPARKDSSGRLYKPLFAFMVIGLNGRIPLNTAGNLAAQVGGVFVPANANAGMPPPTPTPPKYYSGPGHALHLGNSISEVDPMYGLQNGFDRTNIPTGAAGPPDPWAAFSPPGLGVTLGSGVAPAGAFYLPLNSQVDNVGIDVRLTQLRNLLAGTRPPLGANNPVGAVNQDNNFATAEGAPNNQIPMPNGIAEIPYQSATVGQIGSIDGTTVDANGFPYLIRSTTPVAGRWGEAQSIPGAPFPNPYLNLYPTAVAPINVNVVGGNYSNPVRAGYSINIRDILSGLPPDAADDNFNTYDPFPLRQTTVNGDPNPVYGGEVNDFDYYDAAGAMLLPVERMRRWVTPADINGTGSVTTWTAGGAAPNRGPDAVGRVEFTSYFRPPGAPGVISTNYTLIPPAQPGIPRAVGDGLGTVQFPGSSTNYYVDGYNPAGITVNEGGALYAYVPDMTSNPLHGLEQGRFPNQAYVAGSGLTPQRSGGSPAGITYPTPGPLGPGAAYLNVDATDIPQAYPTYDFYINSNFHSDGLNEADEMNMYSPNPLWDSAFGPTDLEWLYRKQDVDGASLTSRLQQLAPVSFTNGLDGARRRRLFALDTFDQNNFSWTTDNPNGAFPTNSRFTSTANAGFTTLNVSANMNTLNPEPSSPLNPTLPPGYLSPTPLVLTPTPALAHQDNKINLNYPLPVSNDPNEPIRQKWINDAYQLMKSVLPPKAVDTPEELAQLSQYVINIIDFRDTDGTMTHWINPDVVIAYVPITANPTAAVTLPKTAITLAFAGTNPQPPSSTGGTNPTPAVSTTTIPLDQWGMEHNPVAINEVLAYSFVNNPTGAGVATRVNRFFIELVNTNTSPELSTSVFNATAASQPTPNGAATGTGFSTSLDLGGFVYNTPEAGGPGDPYSGGTWDIIFTADDPYSRPDPFRGQLLPFANLYAATPLSQYTFNAPTPPATPLVGAATPVSNNPVPAGTATDGFDVLLQPLDAAGSIPPPILANYPLTSLSNTNLNGVSYPLATNYFYVFGNVAPAGMEIGSPAPGTNVNPQPLQTGQTANLTTYAIPSFTPVVPTGSTLPVTTLYGPPSMIQTVKTTMDPTAVVTGALLTTSPIPIYQGVLPAVTIPAQTGGTTTTDPNPSITTALPGNYVTKIPSMAASPTAGGAYPIPGSYYWVCLRRPANLFAPVSISNPMVVVDSARFPYTDGTAPLGTGAPVPGSTGTATNPVPQSAGAPAPFSVQRYQPYRGGHAVPVPAPAGSTLSGTAGATTPVDTRYGYTEQIVVPSIDSQTMMNTQGIYTTSGGTFYATQKIYHTLGWANEFEQGSGNSGAEPWDYFPFNDRDFTSVAELLLVPGCSPGLFTKQFVEFPPSFGNVTNIFNAVIPNTIPPTFVSTGTANSGATIQGVYTTTTTGGGTTGGGTAGGGGGGQPGGGTGTTTATYNFVQPYNTASTPFTYTDASATSPQPRSYPYLNDEFFYTAFGASITLDPTGGLVGGYTGDGWFKMLEFFEVPSQAIGAYGPVAQGSNFDWLRADIKPGQLNLNLIMDEEVFFSVAGDQNIAQSNGQSMDAMGNYQVPSDQFSQQLLNFNQIAGLPALPAYYQLTASGPPNYMLVAPAVGSTTPQVPPPTPGYSPVPLFVTSSLFNGTPATAVPISTQGVGTAGMAALDPVSYSFFTTNSGATPPAYGPSFYGNYLKTAWVQFLNLRHGGSGFVFGFGAGAVGQNSAVMPVTPLQSTPIVPVGYATGIPADRPFRSLSYPDIDYTIMRPAALPPTIYTNPAPDSSPSTYTYTPATVTAPAIFTATNLYAGDPGIRNPTLYLGYPSQNYPGTLPPTTGIPTGLATFTTPWLSAAGTAIFYEPSYPPAIPVRRLFQVPDAYTGGTVYLSNMGVGAQTTWPPAATVPPTPPPTAAPVSFPQGASNASSAGDQFMNNTRPLVPPDPYTVTTNLPFTSPGAVAPVVYPITPTGVANIMNPSGNNPDLYWPGSAAARLHDGVVGDTATTVSLSSVPGLPSNVNLGSANNDQRQHPYWRTEQLQRIMNLTTPRTHQYAVWMTIGFFEVTRQGDLGMFAYNATLAFDTLGPEIGAANGKSTRYRGFFLVDRLQLTGFNPSSPTAFRQAVVYRQRIQ
jgi:large repetitive protein